MAAIYLIRHGQASFGADDYDNLTSAGLRQAELLGEALRCRLKGLDLTLCGSMRRHRQSAQACLGAMGLESQRDEDPGWNEYDHEQVIAAFEPRFTDRPLMFAELAADGRPRRAFQQMFEKAAARWVSAEHGKDYAESFVAFRARVDGALARLTSRLEKAQTAIVFTSGGPISSITSRLLHVPHERALHLSFSLANATITKLVCRGDRIQLSAFGEQAHLERPDASYITY